MKNHIPRSAVRIVRFLFRCTINDMHLNLKKTLYNSLLTLGVVSLFFFFLVACNTKKSHQMQPCPAIQPALVYLQNQYNPALGLLREAPTAAPNTYWLNNDNFLAALAFQRAGMNTEKENLQSVLDKYEANSTDLAKILNRTPAEFPPGVSEVVVKWQSADGREQIRDEVTGTTAFFEDWDTYTNLSLLEALNTYNQRKQDQAKEIFNQALEAFDGTGFRDKAFDKNYETYKLALAIYIGSQIGSNYAERNQMISILLSMQAENGGFYTHYDANFSPAGDTNTETTSWAILALQAAGCYTGN